MLNLNADLQVSESVARRDWKGASSLHLKLYILSSCTVLSQPLLRASGNHLGQPPDSDSRTPPEPLGNHTQFTMFLELCASTGFDEMTRAKHIEVLYEEV